jgi:hypothetical protein
MTNNEKKAFYAQCGEILGIAHEWNDPVPRRTRWNTRFLGNGRFPGFGLIRCYDTQIMITSKLGTKMFASTEAVYKYLKEVKV